MRGFVTAVLVLVWMMPLSSEARRTAEPIPAGSWNARLLDARSYKSSFRAARRALQRKPHLVQLRRDLPTVVIPDLHGRRDYLDGVLATRDPASGRTYGDLLRRGRVQVICLGDVMHTERRGSLWRRGMPEQAMRMEMAESLGTLKRIAELKTAHPDNFHLLRGNHDDVGPAQGQPCRLPTQIAKTRQYLEANLGRPMVCELAKLFAALPVAAAGKGFVAAHSNPMFAVSRRDVVQGNDKALASLARTRVPTFQALRRQHTRGRRGAAASTLREVATALGAERQDYYIHGHLWARPMKVNGQQIYFGNPHQQTFLRLDPGSSTNQPWNNLFQAGSGRRVPVPGRPGDGS